MSYDPSFRVPSLLPEAASIEAIGIRAQASGWLSEAETAASATEVRLRDLQRQGRRAGDNRDDERARVRDQYFLALNHLREKEVHQVATRSGERHETQERERLSRVLHDAQNAAEATYQALCERLAAERERLEARLREQEAVVQEREEVWTSLREARSSAYKRGEEGLAPWDSEALHALRAWGDLPPATERDRETLTGKETAALFQSALGISRSSYYARVRPLLRTHHLAGELWWHYDDGRSVRTHPQGIKRWRREEAEALVRFLQSGSVRVAAPESESR